MPPQVKEVGGGPATGLADDFVRWLSQGLNTGTFGAGNPAGTDAHGATMGIGSYLNDILSGGAGKVGGAFSDMISKQGERDVMGLRSRFGAGGGTAFGTGAQYGESLLRSETAPKMTAAIGGLQQNALAMLLPLFANIAGKGLSQRSTTVSPNPWASAASIAAPFASLFMPQPNIGIPGAPAGSTGFVEGEWDWLRGSNVNRNPTMEFDPNALAHLFAGLGG